MQCIRMAVVKDQVVPFSMLAEFSDRYSHGVDLTAADIAALVTNQTASNGLP